MLFKDSDSSHIPAFLLSLYCWSSCKFSIIHTFLPLFHYYSCNFPISRSFLPLFSYRTLKKTTLPILITFFPCSKKGNTSHSDYLFLVFLHFSYQIFVFCHYHHNAQRHFAILIDEDHEIQAFMTFIY